MRTKLSKKSQITPDARRVRGLLKSSLAAPPDVAQMDEGVAKLLLAKHAAPGGKPK